MRAALVIGMGVCVVTCVAAGLADLAVLALGGSLGGLALLGVAVEHSRPRHWTRRDGARSR